MGLGHEPFAHVRPRLDGGFYQSSFWLVGERKPEPGVDLCLVCWIGLLDHAYQIAYGGDDGRDVIPAHVALADGGSDLGLGRDLSGLCLGDPRADDGRVCPGLEASRYWLISASSSAIRVRAASARETAAGS